MLTHDHPLKPRPPIFGINAALRPLLIALAAFMLMLFAPQRAHAVTCSTFTVISPSPITVDVVGNDMASVSSDVRFKAQCRVDKGDWNQFYCLYMVPLDKRTIRDNSSYYLTATGDSRLGFTLGYDNFLSNEYLYGRAYLLRLDGSGVYRTLMLGWSYSESTDADIGDASKPTIDEVMTLRFFDRQQQDRVRASSPVPLTNYSNDFTIKMYYGSASQGAELKTWCQNPTGAKVLIAPFHITAIVPPKCQLENLGILDFGIKGSVAAIRQKTTATTNIDVRCTYETAYKLSLDRGLYEDKKSGTRRMKSGDNYLAYSLTSDNPGPFTTGSKGNTVDKVNHHVLDAELVTPLAVAPAAGNYADTLVLTLTF